MAVISCPSCNKKISNKAEVCSYCQIDLNNLDAEKLSTLAQTNFIKKSQRLMNYSFVAMLLFCGGFWFLFWLDAQPGTWQYIMAVISTIVGFILYLVTRVRLIMLKRSSK